MPFYSNRLSKVILIRTGPNRIPVRARWWRRWRNSSRIISSSCYVTTSLIHLTIIGCSSIPFRLYWLIAEQWQSIGQIVENLLTNKHRPNTTESLWQVSKNSLINFVFINFLTIGFDRVGYGVAYTQVLLCNRKLPVWIYITEHYFILIDGANAICTWLSLYAACVIHSILTVHRLIRACAESFQTFFRWEKRWDGKRQICFCRSIAHYVCWSILPDSERLFSVSTHCFGLPIWSLDSKA